MSKDKSAAAVNKATVTEEAPKPDAAAVVAEQPAAEQPAEQAAPAEQPAAAEPTVAAYEVEIPQCLLGKRVFIASSPDDAYRQYRELGGINGHIYMQVVKKLDPECESAVNAFKAAEAAKQAAK